MRKLGALVFIAAILGLPARGFSATAHATFADQLRHAGFIPLSGEALGQHQQVGGYGYVATADLSGDGIDDLLTVEDPNGSSQLTARRNGLPVWTRTVAGMAWLNIVNDVDGNGGKDLFLYEIYDKETQYNVTLNQYRYVLSMISGATGKTIWSKTSSGLEFRSGFDVGVGLAPLVWGEPTPDANGDGRPDVLIVTRGLPSQPVYADTGGVSTGVWGVRVCVADGMTGVLSSSCLQFDSQQADFILPLPGVTPDHRADILVQSEIGSETNLFLATPTGKVLWSRFVSSDYHTRWPWVDFTTGDQSGQILFGSSCAMFGCYPEETDAFDAASGRQVWHRDFGSQDAGADFDGDGHADVVHFERPSDFFFELRIHSSATGAQLFPTRSYSVQAVPGYRVSFDGWTPADLNGDGYPDLLATWTYSERNDYYLRQMVVDGKCGAVLWDRTGKYPFVSAGADLNGDGRADLLMSTATKNFKQEWTYVAHAVDGITGASLWDAGPIPGYPNSEPIPAHLAPTAGSQLIFSWRDAAGDYHYAGFGEEGRLWSVHVSPDGTTTIDP